MKCYRVKSGKYAHRLPNGKLQVFLAGEVVKTDQDLVKAFQNKFEEVLDVNPVASAVTLAYKARDAVLKVEEDLPPEPEDADEPAVVDESKEEEETSEPEEVEEPTGKDVTKRFPFVKAAGIKVLMDGEDYTVVVDKDTTAGPFTDRSAVLEWFKTWKKANK